ncbi:junctional adhesion molecule A-like [Pristis pectinata]|uniref:junctional adhesion molecule A-like n=1 Tax=Pristis pectinata TaxID=685728 RepID=UPI00223E73F0|nr:junctional adhesion molecule A-like [Pristis pectinata]
MPWECGTHKDKTGSQGKVPIWEKCNDKCIRPVPGRGDWEQLLLVPSTGSYTVKTSTPEVTVPVGAAADLYCEYSADFGEPRVEWKFRDLQGSLTLVYYNKKITANYEGRVAFSPRALHFKETLATDSGQYMCDVNKQDGSQTGSVTVKLVVQVPPAVPQASVPTSVTTGSSVQLKCVESQGYPRPTYRWYRDQVLMPEKPAGSPTFRNSSYSLQPSTGLLTFDPVSRSDAGEYMCEAVNGVGEPVKSSPPIRMEVYDTNVGGIVAGVIVALIILAFLGVSVWFAYRKGYLGRKYHRLLPFPPVSERCLGLAAWVF